MGQPDLFNAKVTSADGGGTRYSRNNTIIEKRKNEARKFEFRLLRCGGNIIKTRVTFAFEPTPGF